MRSRSRSRVLLAAAASTLFTAACADGRGAPGLAAPAAGGAPPAATTDGMAILDMTPDWGPASGGTVVTLQGQFGMGATVSFNGAVVPATSISASQAVFATTPGIRGWHVPVTVTSASGQSTPAKYFTYEGTSPLAMFPDYGPTVGATRITLHGENFQQGAAVMFDGVALPTTFLSTTSLVVLGPAGEGTVKVYVADEGATRDTIRFTYQAPQVSGFSPQSGSVAGGTLITILGANFGFNPTVTIGGQAAQLERAGHTEILARSPAGSVGPAPLVVTTAGQSSVPVSYTYAQYRPAILGLTPTHGPAAGGNSVVVAGMDFGTNPTVTFGGRVATLTSISNTSLTAVAPAGQGTVTVTVVNAGGASNPAQYTYDAGVPVVTGISPGSAPTAGGMPVTITGSNLGAGAAVTFGTAVAPVQSATFTQLVVASPAGEGTVPVVVRTNGGSSEPVSFTYAAPAITTITPANGPSAGGTPITISGANFGITPVVTFDGVVVPLVARSHSTIAAMVPAGEAGHVAQVQVTVAGQPSNTKEFTYDTPRLTAILPSHGPTAGGTTVTLTGNSFGTDPSVTFGAAAARVVAASQTTIMVMAPAGQGTVPVVVSAGGATSNALRFDYDAPAIAAISPASGPAAGGTRITITGSSFGTNGVVTVGGAQATPASWSHGQVVAVTPPGTGGSDAAVVLTVAGTASNAASFHYDAAPPSLRSLTPESGPTSGGTEVTLTGADFGPSGVVTIGGVAAPQRSWTATRIVAVTPAGAPGTTVPVVVTTQGMASNALSFRYVCPAGTIAEGSSCVTPMEHLEHLVSQLPADARQGIATLASQAGDKLSDGNPANDAAACGQLGAALNQVASLEKRGKLTPAQAGALRQAIALVQEGAGCR